MPKFTRFTHSLLVKFDSVRSDRIASLQDHLVWEIEYTGKPLPQDFYDLPQEDYVIVPLNFESDGITAPRIMWWLYPPWGHSATRAAILHDYLLMRYKTEPHPIFKTRSSIDKVFLEAMKTCEIGFVSRHFIYLTCRLFALIKLDYK